MSVTVPGLQEKAGLTSGMLGAWYVEEPPKTQKPGAPVSLCALAFYCVQLIRVHAFSTLHLAVNMPSGSSAYSDVRVRVFEPYPTSLVFHIANLVVDHSHQTLPHDIFVCRTQCPTE